LPSKAPLEWCKVVVDSREQLPFSLDPLRSEVGKCDVGDYQLADFPNEVAVERKSLADLVSCCGTDRERFERQILRLMGIQSRLLVVEGSWSQIEMGQWRSRISPNAVRNSLLGWMGKGLPISIAGDRQQAQIITKEFLYLAWRRRYKQARNTLKTLEEC
jgi:ERCC4-type nuclease